jgi:tripartite-type tricarboxylate transporter receptor subunit TctC
VIGIAQTRTGDNTPSGYFHARAGEDDREQKMRGKEISLLAAGMLSAFVPFALPAGASEFPSRPVKIITQGAAGSGPDVIARLVAAELARHWQQQVLIVNQPGGGGVMAARAAVTAEPDGYTLYIPTITSFVIMPEMQRKLPFDMMQDFTQIGFVAETPMMIGTSPALAVTSVKAFVELSHQQPGQLFYAANNRGSLPHLTGELFRKKTGANVTFVPYAGAAAGLQDLMGGRIAMIVESVGALAAAVQGGSVKPLGVASARRLPSMPDVPTLAETVAGFEALGWFVLSAPAKIPTDIIRKVNRDLNTVVTRPAFQQQLLALGAFARPMDPAQTTAFIRNEEQLWRPLVRDTGLGVQ